MNERNSDKAGQALSMLDEGSIGDRTHDVDKTNPMSNEQRDMINLSERPTTDVVLTPIHSCIESIHGDYVSTITDHGSHD